MSVCPQCDHDSASHWPDHGRSTTACVICLDGQILTRRSWDGGKGVCCYSAAAIERSAK